MEELEMDDGQGSFLTRRTKMHTKQQQMADIFNEWARRYAKNPDEFCSILDADGKPVEDYGKRCAIYFEEIAKGMNSPLTICKGERCN